MSISNIGSRWVRAYPFSINGVIAKFNRMLLINRMLPIMLDMHMAISDNYQD